MQFANCGLFFALAGLAACGANAGDSDADRDLERFRSANLFEVRYLIVDQPRDPGACGGQPGPGSGPAPASLNALMARRLARLADLAEIAAQSLGRDPSAVERVDLNLERLRGLQIVEVGDFARKLPSSNPLCNGTACPSDIEAAAAENEARASALEALAIAAQSL